MTASPLTILPLAALVAAVGTWLLARLARRVGAVAKVQANRWHDSGDIPRLAGPALLVATAPWLGGDNLMVLACVCALGTFDDIRPLSPAVKALGLMAAAIGAVWSTGQWWAGPALWLVANAVNLLDHADGIAASAAAAAFIGLGGDAGLAGAGACAGFLLFNYPPARAFMGDSGSLTLGAMAVVIGAEGAGLGATGAEGAGLGAIGAWCAIPLADAVRVSVSRVMRGQKPWVGGVDHSGHVLLRAGMPARLLPPAYFGAALLVGGLVSTWL